jgi:hypothetical protein
MKNMISNSNEAGLDPASLETKHFTKTSANSKICDSYDSGKETSSRHGRSML